MKPIYQLWKYCQHWNSWFQTWGNIYSLLRLFQPSSFYSEIVRHCVVQAQCYYLIKKLLHRALYNWMLYSFCPRNCCKILQGLMGYQKNFFPPTTEKCVLPEPMAFSSAKWKRQEISDGVKKDLGKSIPHTNLTILCSQVSVLLSGRSNTTVGLLKKNRKSLC